MVPGPGCVCYATVRRSNSHLTYTFPEWHDWNVTTAGRRLNLFVENLLHDYLAFFP